MIEMNRGIREHRWRGSRGERRGKKVCGMFEGKEKGQRKKKKIKEERDPKENSHIKEVQDKKTFA